MEHLTPKVVRLETRYKDSAFKADVEMDFLGIRGTKVFCVPDYFNFADVIDEWAQKEKSC